MTLSRIERIKGGYLFFCSGFVDKTVVPFAHGYYDNDNFLLPDFVNQPVSSISKLYFIPVVTSG